MKKILLRSFFLGIILLLIGVNFFKQLPLFINSVHILKTHQVQSIGREFFPLSPYLSKISGVGYVTCLESSYPLRDVAIMGPYQEAQFVLSPTIVDYFHPLDYQYIILQCPGNTSLRQIQKHLSSFVILKKFDGVFLLSRKKKS